MEEGRGDGSVEMFGQHLHDGTTHEPIYSLDNASARLALRVSVSHTEYYPCPEGRGKVTYNLLKFFI